MKKEMGKLLALLLMAYIMVAFGQDYESEILRLIEEVKKAPPSERYKIMNELKIKLRELNRKEREEMIREVYERLKGRERFGREERFEKEEHFEKMYKEHEVEGEKHEERFEMNMEKEEHKFEGREEREHMEEREY